MENNLDKYFRDNLNDRKFELKDEYWLGAEKLLDQQDKRRKRRGFFWWFGCGLAVLALIVLGYQFLGKNNAAKPQAAANENTANSPSASGGTSPVFGENDAPSTTGQAEENTAGEEAVASISAGEKSKSVAENSTSKTIKNSKTSKVKSIDNQQVARSKTGFPLTLKSETDNQAPQLKVDQSNSSETPVNNAVAAGKSDPQFAQQTTSGSQAQSENLLKAADENPKVEHQLAPNFLALLPAFVKGNLAQKTLAVKATAEKIEVTKQQKLHLGLLASQMLLPRPEPDEKTLIGLRAGLVVRYDLRGDFYLSSGLQYQRRTGTFEVSETATAKRFSFGVTETAQHLRPTSLHYLCFPVLVGWKRRHHLLEGGILFDYLTGVRGEAGSYQFIDMPVSRQFVVDKEGWITDNGFRRFMPTAQLAYNYQLGRQWSIGATANYTLGGILDPAFDFQTDYFLKESEMFNLGLQIQYLFE